MEKILIKAMDSTEAAKVRDFFNAFKPYSILDNKFLFHQVANKCQQLRQREFLFHDEYEIEYIN